MLFWESDSKRKCRQFPTTSKSFLNVRASCLKAAQRRENLNWMLNDERACVLKEREVKDQELLSEKTQTFGWNQQVNCSLRWTTVSLLTVFKRNIIIWHFRAKEKSYIAKQREACWDASLTVSWPLLQNKLQAVFSFTLFLFCLVFSRKYTVQKFEVS